MIERGKNSLGRKGEEEVCTFLIKRGHTILERNYRSGHLEIDIISLAQDGIHFVEVKSRTVPYQAEPETNVNRIKQKRLALAAERYLTGAKDRKLDNYEVFFDVAAVVYDEGSMKINYFDNAFIPIFV